MSVEAREIDDLMKTLWDVRFAYASGALEIATLDAAMQALRQIKDRATETDK